MVSTSETGSYEGWLRFVLIIKHLTSKTLNVFLPTPEATVIIRAAANISALVTVCNLIFSFLLFSVTYRRVVGWKSMFRRNISSPSSESKNMWSKTPARSRQSQISTLRMRVTCPLEMSAALQRTTRLYVLEDGTLHTYRSEKLKTCKVLRFVQVFSSHIKMRLQMRRHIINTGLQIPVIP